MRMTLSVSSFHLHFKSHLDYCMNKINTLSSSSKRPFRSPTLPAVCLTGAVPDLCALPCRWWLRPQCAGPSQRDSVLSGLPQDLPKRQRVWVGNQRAPWQQDPLSLRWAGHRQPGLPGQLPPPLWWHWPQEERDWWVLLNNSIWRWKKKPLNSYSVFYCEFNIGLIWVSSYV